MSTANAVVFTNSTIAITLFEQKQTRNQLKLQIQNERRLVELYFRSLLRNRTVNHLTDGEQGLKFMSD